jgi:maltooligosyltrehalose trehalohydrolase
MAEIEIDGERYRLTVDHDLCMGTRVCIASLPGVFSVDDDTNLSSASSEVLDPSLADAVREGRRREFAKFDAFADEQARARIPDPNARRTFDASIPEPGPQAGEWRALYRELLALRQVHIVPRLKGTVGLAAEVTGPARVRARWRMADGATLTIVIDLGHAPEPIAEEAGQLIYREGYRFAAWIVE